MIEALKTCKGKVKQIMEKYPATQDSDKLLWLAYVVEFHDLRKELGDEAYFKFKKIFMSEELPPMESIRRMRQKIQETELQGTLREEKKNIGKEAKDLLKRNVRHSFTLPPEALKTQ